MRRVVLLLCALVILAAADRPPRAGVSPPVRIGLALSGGAALGIAHVGVLKVFEREGIDVVAVSGNSMGSLVGGLYAAGYSPARMESIAVRANWDLLFGDGMPFGARYLAERRQEERYAARLRHRNLLPTLPSGIVSLQNVDFLMMELLAETERNTGYDFDSLPIPYRAVAVDLVSGRLEVMRDGRLSQAIRASIAIPGVFVPLRLDSMELVDGGVRQYLPVEPLLEFELDLVCAVLTMRRGPMRGNSLIDIVSRSMDLVGFEDLGRQQALADIVIEPDVEAFAHSDFARAAELIAAGERATEAALPRLRELIAGRPIARYRRAVRTRSLPVVRGLRYEGLAVTRTATLRTLVQTRPGGRLMLSRLLEDLTRVFHTGLYEDVNYRLEFAPSESVDVVVELRERPYGFYLFGLRYDNADQVGVGIEVGQGNLWGTGANVRAALQLGNPTDFRVGLSGARLFAFPFSYRLEGAGISLRRSYYELGLVQADYHESGRELELELGYGLGRQAFFTLGLSRRELRYRLPGLLPPALRDLPKQELLFGPSFRLEYNTCDDLYLPRSGVALGLEVCGSLELLGAGREFVRGELNWARVSPLGGRFLFRENWVAGVTIGDSVRAEYFFAGGGDLPGFALGEFSSPYRLSFEPALDFVLADLLGRPRYPLYLRALGAVAAFKRPDLLLSDGTLLADLHWSAGAGLVGNTPLGPFKLLAGWTDFAKPRSFSYAPPAFRVWFEVGRDFRYTR